MSDTERIEFTGATGATLAGILHLPDERAKGSVLLAHCFTCSKDVHAMSRLSKGLTEAGYAVLRFDFTGLGDSDGEFRTSTVSTDVGDLTRAAATLIERGYGPCAMVGHSLGGAATLLAAARIKTVRSIAVIGAPSTASHVRHLFTEVEEELRREGEVCVELAGRPFPIARSFLEDLDNHETLDHISGLARPLLILHAVRDDTVDIEEGEAIFAAAQQPKQFVPLIEADHLLTSKTASERALAILVDWFARTL